jgi:ADP-ribosyl-[dinitrogen reductase] hydrolase
MSDSFEMSLRDRWAGVLLGTAMGDALGLPMEGMRARAVSRRFPAIDRYFLLGRTGFVSDDAEQTALVAQSLSRHPVDRAAFVRAFRRALLGWFLRLPWGIGLGTLRACVRIVLGFSRSGVASAGNGAAMRAAIVGAFFFDDNEKRAAWSEALAETTHIDRRAVDGACFVAELAARCVASQPTGERLALARGAFSTVRDRELTDALEGALTLAARDAPLAEAAEQLNSTGFIIHSAALATFCFVRFGDAPELAMAAAIRAGGDTDTNAAIVGAWTGALHGESGLPPRLLRELHDGGLAGTTHLRALASDLEHARTGDGPLEARYSWVAALFRNIALYPVVLAHAVRVFFVR